jgi:hypothetical protein
MQNKKKRERRKKKKIISKSAETAQEMISATATWVRLDTTGKVWALYAMAGLNLKTEDWEWHYVTEEEALACCEEREKEPPAAGHKRNIRAGARDEEAPSPEEQIAVIMEASRSPPDQWPRHEHFLLGGQPFRPRLQDRDHGCVLNSLGHAVGLSLTHRFLIEHRHKLHGYSSVDDVANKSYGVSGGLLHGIRFKRVKGIGDTDQAKMFNLLNMRVGMFIISFLSGKHCLCFDAAKGIFHEPDPSYLYVFPATQRAVVLLDISHIVSVYHVMRS